MDQHWNRKVFKKSELSVQLDELSTVDVGGHRFYVTPNGKKYPSITTLLSQQDKKFLKDWRARVGEKEADRITKYATDTGTELHSIVERYIENENDFLLDAKPHASLMFRGLQQDLNRIDNVIIQEVPLYSHKLKLAGRTDCIAEFDGVLSIIDFKTSKKEKKEEWIDNYFVQGTAYSLMFQDLTQIAIPQIVIIMAMYDASPVVFIKNRKDYFEKFLQIRENYLPKLLELAHD